MDVTYRSLREDEVPSAVDVFLAGLSEYTRAHGLPPPTGYTPAIVAPLYRHLFSTGLFEVAEHSGRVVTIASGIVRESFFFLSMFWSLPEFRGRGIGGPLLLRLFGEARRRGATRHATWSSLDFAAMGSYMKLGMLPGGPVFTFTGVPTRLPPTSAQVGFAPLEPATAALVDRQVRGAVRPLDHAYFEASGARGFQTHDGAAVTGYFYVKDGVIGPAAWLDRARGHDVLGSAVREAARASAEVKLIALGPNETALRVALECELKISGVAQWLRSESFGAFAQYVPSGPALF